MLLGHPTDCSTYFLLLRQRLTAIFVIFEGPFTHCKCKHVSGRLDIFFFFIKITPILMIAEMKHEMLTSLSWERLF